MHVHAEEKKVNEINATATATTTAAATATQQQQQQQQGGMVPARSLLRKH